MEARLKERKTKFMIGDEIRWCDNRGLRRTASKVWTRASSGTEYGVSGFRWSGVYTHVRLMVQASRQASKYAVAGVVSLFPLCM